MRLGNSEQARSRSTLAVFMPDYYRHQFKYMIISFVGFMGVGKSTIAKRLSTLLSSKHIDLDTYIDAKEEMSTTEIFSSFGEAHFRKLEEKYLGEIIENSENKITILSLGGGSLMSGINRELVKNRTTCIYLKASTDILTERISKSRKERPLVQGVSSAELRERIEELMREREPQYEEAASIVIETDGLSATEIINKIMASI